MFLWPHHVDASNYHNDGHKREYDDVHLPVLPVGSGTIRGVKYYGYVRHSKRRCGNLFAGNHGENIMYQTSAAARLLSRRKIIEGSGAIDTRTLRCTDGLVDPLLERLKNVYGK